MQSKAIITLLAAFVGLSSAAPSGAPPAGYSSGNTDNGGETPSYTGGGTYNGPMVEEHFKAILEEHNKYRSGCGLSPVNWNEGIAATAQNYANSNKGACDNMVHNENRGKLGENIACTTDRNADIASEIVAMVQRWGDEVNSCPGDGANCPFKGGSSKDGATGHFTQIADSTCTEIGCGYFKGFFVCNYNPPGNASPSNSCPNGFRGKGSGSGGTLGGDSGSNPTTPAPPSYDTTYRNVATIPVSQTVNRYVEVAKNPVQSTQPVEVIEYVKPQTEPTYEEFVNDNSNNLIPVKDYSTPSYDNNSNDSGNPQPIVSYPNDNSYSGGNNGGSSTPKKDCDEKKKVKKFKKF